MSDLTPENHCPTCKSEHIYPDRDLMVCAECSHEWVPGQGETSSDSATDTTAPTLVRDANGTPLTDGDSVIVIKDLKVKGSSGSVKGGTKVRSIRLIPSVDGHNIACKIEGFGAMNLKSEFVRKA